MKRTNTFSHQGSVNHEERYISKDTEDVNHTIRNKLIDIYRILHPTTAEYTSFSSACDKCKINDMLCHKQASLKFTHRNYIHCIL